MYIVLLSTKSQSQGPGFDFIFMLICLLIRMKNSFFLMDTSNNTKKHNILFLVKFINFKAWGNCWL